MITFNYFMSALPLFKNYSYYLKFDEVRTNLRILKDTGEILFYKVYFSGLFHSSTFITEISLPGKYIVWFNRI